MKTSLPSFRPAISFDLRLERDDAWRIGQAIVQGIESAGYKTELRTMPQYGASEVLDFVSRLLFQRQYGDWITGNLDSKTAAALYEHLTFDRDKWLVRITTDRDTALRMKLTFGGAQ